jgi:hypothetical protein
LAKESLTERSGPKVSVTTTGVSEPDWLLSAPADVDAAGHWVAQLDYRSIADVPFFVVAGVVFLFSGSAGGGLPPSDSLASTPAKLIGLSLGTTAPGTAPRSP